MIVCKDCGYRNAGSDSFCGSCGAFLEWTGERVEQPRPAPVPIPEPEPEPARKGLIARVQSLLYLDVGDQEPVPRNGSEVASNLPGPVGGSMGGSFGGSGMKPLGGTKPTVPPPPGGTAKAVPPPPPGGTAKPVVPPPPPPPPPGGTAKPVVPPPPPPPPVVPPPPPDNLTGLPGGTPLGSRVTEGPGAGALVAPLPAGDTTPTTGVPLPGPGLTTMPVHPAGAGTGAVEPGVVAPQEHGRVRRSVARSAPTRALQPGDLVCGDCGEANLSTRRFCSRCGGELDEAEVVKAPWWRRILPKRKPRAARAAEPDGGIAKTGERRKHRKSIFLLLRRGVAVLLVVSGLAYAAVPDLRQRGNAEFVAGRQRIEDLVFGKYAPVRAVKATSAAADKKHPASAAVDGHWNTYWAAPVAGPRRLTLTFQEPVVLRKALIRGGIAGNLRGSQRPRTLHLVYPTGKGQDLKLDDETDPQEFELDSGGKVGSLEIYIQDTYANVEAKDVAVSEVELFTKE